MIEHSAALRYCTMRDVSAWSPASELQTTLPAVKPQYTGAALHTACCQCLLCLEAVCAYITAALITDIDALVVTASCQRRSDPSGFSEICAHTVPGVIAGG